MYYVSCKGCGCPDMAFNMCSNCLTVDRSEVRKPSFQSTPISPSSLALLASLLAAGEGVQNFV